MDLTDRNTQPMDTAVEERTDWAVEYRFGNGVLDYAYCDYLQLNPRCPWCITHC